MTTITQPALARPIPEGTPEHSPVRVIHTLESQNFTEQQDIAAQYPDGPQRLRGLAGTGKTVLLAQRAAQIHHEHPDWRVTFVFFTRSLYPQIRHRIGEHYRQLSDRREPDWSKLKVLHAWGAREQDGFYRRLAIEGGIKPKTVKDVEQEIGRVSPGEAFKYVCSGLERQSNLPILYDVILIDEGQDLPDSFYRLAYRSLSEPKRLYWAFDEAQSIDSLMVPDPVLIFGRDADGSPVVDLGLGANQSFFYEGTNIRKAVNLNRCYRTPRLLLMAAHGINMGLLRQGVPLQGVSTQEEWKKLGYTVVEGDFTDASVTEGRLVKLERQADTSPHPIDREDFAAREALGDLLTMQTFSSESEEQEWIAEQVANDLHQGFEPSDILIVALSGNETNYLRTLQNGLRDRGIKSAIAGIDTNASEFGQPGFVTISNVYRAKGNEAWKVYVCRFHCATQPLGWKQENELHKRNEAFVALTRTRVWCCVTGVEAPIFDELRIAKEQSPTLSFPAFNKNSLKRIVDEELRAPDT